MLSSTANELRGHFSWQREVTHTESLILLTSFLNFQILSLVNHSKHVTVKVVRGKRGEIKIFPYL